MTPDDPRHGQERGYFAHKKTGRPACPACRQAHSDAEKRRQYDRISGRRRLVDATGTHRRIQALMALGWTQKDIALAAGWKRREQVATILQRQTTVTLPVRARILTVYGALSMQLPASSSHHTRVRNHARQHGWAVPLAWEGLDIDNPTTQPYTSTEHQPDPDELDPVVVDRILGGDFTLARHATWAERSAVITTWTTTTRRPLKDLEHGTGWKPQRYTRPTTKENNAA